MNDDFPYPMLYSNCCNSLLTDGDIVEFTEVEGIYLVVGRCRNCKEMCKFLTEEEMENEDEA